MQVVCGQTDGQDAETGQGRREGAPVGTATIRGLFVSHGTRTDYRHGCRCTPCRAANAGYEAQRARAKADGYNGWVRPDAARAKLEMFAGIGIGHRRAAHLAGVSFRTVQRIRTGRGRRIRADVERAILGIDKPSIARGVHVNGYETRHYVESLVREDFKKAWLAAKLGLRCGRLRIGQLVTVKTALRMRQLHEHLTAE